MTASMIASAAALAAALGLLAAVLSDVRRFEIPDHWPIAIALLWPVYAATMLTWPDWLGGLGAAGLTFALGLLLFARGWMGGGDVKLLAALALWTGLAGLPALLAGTALTGGVLAMLVLVLRQQPALRRRLDSDRPRWLRAQAPLPYAVAILGGTALWASRAPLF